MLIVLGSTNLDQIGTVTRLPRPGETVSGHTFSTAPGGKGANQALAARRAGAEVQFFSAVGEDAFGPAALELLQQDGVDLTGVRRTDAHTGIAMILVDEAGENVIAVLPGANATVDEAAAEAALAGRGPGDVLVLQQEIPMATNRRALALAKAQGVRTLLNIAPFVPETTGIAAAADILIANETEFALLVGEFGDRLEAAMLERAATCGQIVVVTLGAAGVRIAVDGTILSIPSMPVEVVDTVGAGDTFCGYFAAGLSAGDTIERAARRAAAAASLACTRAGAQPSIPYRGELSEVD
ncbi:ribokinase [Devosia albogilva]|uniref:Ribokinase n=1 Tax=Devosia albogilva TaxID=429726 RepID=A0ABW5QIV9_9HYPH